jgi:hypothetical protein
MDGTHGVTVLVVATLLFGSIAGVGLVAAEDFPSATDGDISNGEELRVAEDDDDQVKDINYTFVIADHTPGKEVDARHFAVGLTENATLHRIKLYSEDFGYSNCEPDNTAAFGIDRRDNDPGTNTDVSLLTSFKSYNSQEDFIDIRYYKEEKLAGSPISGSVHDQIVAAQNGCYDNPSEPGWYRINGTITGSSNGDTTTDYKIRDLSNWIYICDCSSRADAEQQLGPPPGQGDDGGGSGGDGGSGGSSTPTATPTPRSDDGGSSTATPTATRTPTPTPTPRSDDGSDGGADTPTPTPGDDDGGSGESDTATASPTPTSGGGGGPTETATPSATAAGSGGDTAGSGTDGGAASDGPRTPTAGAGPGFGLTVAAGGLLVIGLLALRRH